MGGRRLWHGFPGLLLALVLLIGCGQEPTPDSAPTATPIPPIPLRTDGGVVKASATIVPALKADLGFPIAGWVGTIAVDVGDHVQANELLATLNNAAAKAAVVQAQARLQAAQAHLAELKAGPRPQEVAAARARLEVAQAQLAQLTESARPAEIEAAKAEVEAAQSALNHLFEGPSEVERIAAQAELANAEAALKQAQAAYDRVSWRNDVAMLPESLALQQATNNYKAAKARYDALFAKPSADVVAEARARLQKAKAALDRLEHPATAAQIAAAQAQVHMAQAELDLLVAGAQPAEIAAAEAAVAQAQAALQAAQADLANTELRAPFAGVITARYANPGELVQPAQRVLTLADLDSLRVETTDLSERDVARVAVGEKATVYVEALGAEVHGRVARIAPQANIVGGDVVYTVIVSLDEKPEGLRWGMSADVEIEGK
ncbi:MAG: efflux RND transporter periplasmic adaptor subunit [Anaerolineae bacterium]|nr:efflux RND transporter periplasmic adaptor subunit [Anaerolineae bacterium]